MMLRFSRKGKQFFFATFSLEGRRKLLSRIVEGQRYPELSACGELVQAALLAVHEVWPAAGISDFSVMPDHVHVLFICDYGKGLKASPFFMAHCVMDAVEAALDKHGSAEQAISAMCGKEGSCRERRKALSAGMADLIRESRALYIAKCRERRTDGAPPRTPDTTSGAGSFVSAPSSSTESLPDTVHGKAQRGSGRSPNLSLQNPLAPSPSAESLPNTAHGKAQRGSGQSPNLSLQNPPAPSPSTESLPDTVHGKAQRGSGQSPVLFDKSCYIELSFDSTQLKTIRRYIRLNPARALWKEKNPDMFLRHRGIRARALDESRQWDAMGALTLLASPFLFHVRLTMKKTAEEHRQAIDEIIEKARRGMVPVSGFISPGEKESLRRLKAEPTVRFVKMLPYGLPPKYDPSAEDSRELASRRLLILSGFPQSRKDDRAAFRRNCLEMNDLAAALCAKARE